MICKTLLRKCRRFLQDKFNGLTDYFAKKRTMDFSFMRACVEKLVSEEPDLQGKPELDLVFYLGKDI